MRDDDTKNLFLERAFSFIHAAHLINNFSRSLFRFMQYFIYKKASNIYTLKSAVDNNNSYDNDNDDMS